MAKPAPRKTFNSVIRERRVATLDALSDISRAASNTFSDPAFVLCALISGVLIFTHIDDVYNGPFGQFLRDHSDHAYVRWLIANLDKVWGLCVMAPTLFRSAPKYRNFMVIGVSAAVVALPAYSLLHYTIASAALHLYLHVRVHTTKMLIIVGVAAYFYLTGAIKPIGGPVARDTQFTQQQQQPPVLPVYN
nr:p24 [Ailanthus crinkle leaf associated bluner-like virus]